MLPRLLLMAALAAALALVAACSSSEPLPGADPTSGGSTQEAGPLAEGSCWTGTRLGADPQDILKLSASFDVPYLVAARAVADRPAFADGVDCSEEHAVEVFKLVRLPALDAQLSDYAALLRTQTPLYNKVTRGVEQACMTRTLAKAAARTGLRDAVMRPVLPVGAELGWAPAAPTQWAKGQHVFACTLTWTHPARTLYASVFTKSFGAGHRTCIDNKALAFVDCARPHERERIAVIEARDAVAAGSFPGPKAVKDGPGGRHLDVSDAAYAKLDAACTAYLRAISTTRKLTGIANVDLDQWPTPDGSYPIYCDADRPPDEDPLVTQGSVYNR
jgi:hypothetical protein